MATPTMSITVAIALDSAALSAKNRLPPVRFIAVNRGSWPSCKTARPAPVSRTDESFGAFPCVGARIRLRSGTSHFPRGLQPGPP